MSEGGLFPASFAATLITIISDEINAKTAIMIPAKIAALTGSEGPLFFRFFEPPNLGVPCPDLTRPPP
jgi:hypothetical protein